MVGANAVFVGLVRDARRGVGDLRLWLGESGARYHFVTAGVHRSVRNGEIAEELAVSPSTVKNHVTSVFSKIGVRDRAQAVIAAYEAGLVTPRG